MLTQRRLLELARAGLEKEMADIDAMIGSISPANSQAQAETVDTLGRTALPAGSGTRRRTVPVVRPRVGAGKPKSTQAGRKTRTMTAEGRARIANAQAARWKKVREAKETAAKQAAQPSVTV
jgi:hypothetical protein